MTCRHTPGDPNCTHGRGYHYEPTPPSPDIKNYEVLDVVQVGSYLIFKLKYPNCAKCSYEGVKIIVFHDVSMKDALMWREIDPHFRDPSKPTHKRAAPPPVARFPGSQSGLMDAIEYAKWKTR